MNVETDRSIRLLGIWARVRVEQADTNADHRVVLSLINEPYSNKELYSPFPDSRGNSPAPVHFHVLGKEIVVYYFPAVLLCNDVPTVIIRAPEPANFTNDFRDFLTFVVRVS
jgi:hypothetical protein